jgi:hypothetical protein
MIARVRREEVCSIRLGALEAWVGFAGDVCAVIHGVQRRGSGSGTRARSPRSYKWPTEGHSSLMF